MVVDFRRFVYCIVYIVRLSERHLSPIFYATSGEQRYYSIMVSLVNLILSGITFKFIYPFLEQRYINIDHNISVFNEILRLVFILLLSDTFFYWVHRFLHLPGVYKYAHKMHHSHLDPITWSAFYFHPLELIITFLIVFTTNILRQNSFLHITSIYQFCYIITS